MFQGVQTLIVMLTFSMYELYKIIILMTEMASILHSWLCQMRERHMVCNILLQLVD